MTSPPDCLPWFTFRAGSEDSQPWEVYLSAEKMFLEGEYVVGSTDFANNLILVDARQSREDQDETLLHEFMHVAARNGEAKLLRRDAEETAISRISPELYGLLRLHGWKPPRRPSGYAELKRRADRRPNLCLLYPAFQRPSPTQR